MEESKPLEPTETICAYCEGRGKVHMFAEDIALIVKEYLNAFSALAWLARDQDPIEALAEEILRDRAWLATSAPWRFPSRSATTRMLNTLRAAGFCTVGDLARASFQDLARNRGIGMRTIRMVREALSYRGLDIRARLAWMKLARVSESGPRTSGTP